MGQTRTTVGPVLIWLMVAAVIGGLSETPEWSTKLLETLAISPWVKIGQILAPTVLAVMTIIYIVSIIRTARTAQYLAFVRLLYGAGTTIVLAVITIILHNHFGTPRPCHTLDVGGTCPPEISFSYPSLYAVIVFALAVSMAYSIPWSSYLMFPLAILEGVSSIIAGHQYPHDVLVGAVIGVFAGIGLLYMFIKFQANTARNMADSRANKVKLQQRT